jgi:predicted metal-dependent peptidase
MRQPIPVVAVVLDTSGSIGADQYTLALGEVGRILATVGLPSLWLLGTDTRVHTVKELRSIASGLTMNRGGGTDMQAGVAYAMTELPARPDVLVILTDCETAWAAAGPGIPVVVGRVLSGAPAPVWAAVIDIGKV